MVLCIVEYILEVHAFISLENEEICREYVEGSLDNRPPISKTVPHACKII